MERFATELREVARGLDVPQRVRAEILLELSGELEAAYADHRSRGLTEAEAERRALECVLGPPEMVRQLARIHLRTRVQRSGLLGHPDFFRRGIGLVLLTVAVVPLLVMAGAILLWGMPPSTYGVSDWPIIAVGAGVVVIALVEAVRLGIGRTPRTHRLTLLALLSAVAPALGGLAAVVGAYHAAMAVAAGSAMDSIDVMQQVAQLGSMLAGGILIGLVGALSWFGLTEGRTHQAIRSVTVLMSEGSTAGQSRPDIIPLTERRKA